MAQECARLAATAEDARSAARYHFLERSWLYLLRLKLKRSDQRE
jgi:hypothetical protein